jgi:hypothetical protein
MQLETAASSAANDAAGQNNQDKLKDVQEKYEELKVAVKKYHEYLGEVGI